MKAATRFRVIRAISRSSGSAICPNISASGHYLASRLNLSISDVLQGYSAISINSMKKILAASMAEEELKYTLLAFSSAAAVLISIVLAVLLGICFRDTTITNAQVCYAVYARRIRARIGRTAMKLGERTKQLKAEEHKTYLLLCQMMPRSVVDSLREGIIVQWHFCFCIKRNKCRCHRSYSRVHQYSSASFTASRTCACRAHLSRQ